MKKDTKKGTVLARVAKKVAPHLGAKVLLEPGWGMAGQIIFKNGRHTYFKYNTLDLNSVGSAEVAKDKDYANFFMKSLGYPIVPGGKTFYSKEWSMAVGAKDRGIEAAYAHAQKLGFPVVVKPNSGSQGYGVAIVENKREFYAAMRVAFTSDKIVLVQKPVYGKDYRIFVLDDKVIVAYERQALSVVGDGKSTIAQLLKKKHQQLLKMGREAQIDHEDPRIIQKLKRQGLTRASILPKDSKIFLLDNSNLSTGGDAVDVTETIHPKFKEMAIRLTKEMGLRLCGVDLIVEGTICDAPKKYWILEINAGPGLDHYAKISGKQEKFVEELYLQMLKHLSTTTLG
jgi:D-alanine-D-alanine ligase-like ATP-grasp enzyme